MEVIEILGYSTSDFIRYHRKDGGLSFRRVGFATDELLKDFARSCGIVGDFIVEKEWNGWKQEIIKI